MPKGALDAMAINERHTICSTHDGTTDTVDISELTTYLIIDHATHIPRPEVFLSVYVNENLCVRIGSVVVSDHNVVA